MTSFVVGLILGAIAVVAVEVAAVLYFIYRLNQKTKKSASFLSSSSSVDSTEVLDPQQSLNFAYSKQGFVWVLESEKIPKENVPKEQKKKKNFLEVYPVRKYAKIKDRALILTGPDGYQIGFPLKGCVIEAVSASSLSSRKWAKRLPIKVECKTSVIYNGSKIIYIFLETSWEKESWGKALRLASCKDKKRLDWFTKLNEEFHIYLTSLNAGYPSFMKPMGIIGESPSTRLIVEPTERAVSSSKVRLFWKKLARKASKPCIESKSLSSYSGREERKIYEKFRPFQESVLGASSVKSVTSKLRNSSGEENSEPLSSTFPRSKIQNQLSVVSDADSDDKFIIDEATLCWNLLIFRFFFDAKNNVEMKSSIQAQIQRTLSNMRTPSYIGEIFCTNIVMGNLPPYVHDMRVLSTDMNEVWAFEIYIEYAGGMVLDVETRLEVRELDVQKDIIDANSEESSSVRDVSSDLLEGFEYFGKQLNISEETIDGQVQKDEGDPKPDGLKNHKSTVSATTSGSRWKSILNSIAKQVSQVPISLSIRVAALRGTLRLHIKPPPSDQLWFGFTSMPDIEFDLESSVGDQKITSGHVALFLINRFKASIRETMVLPNCESVSIPWMLAEKDDWVPRNVAPFIWLNHEAGSDHATTCESFSSRTAEAKITTEATRATSIDEPEHKNQNLKNLYCNELPHAVSKVASMPTTSSSSPSIQKSKSLQELRTPLLAIDGPQETCQQNKEEILEYRSPYTSSIRLEKQIIATEEDDSRQKKSGRRTRMLDMGKNMREKLEEKRRHIEEKGRHIVEKMRGP